METGTIRKIAFGAQDSAKPTLPAAGGNVTWASPWVYTLGGQPGASDTGYLDEDTVAMKEREESLDIDPPLAQNRLDEIIFKNGLDTVSFAAYTVDAAILALDSTAVNTSGTVEKGTTITYRAMCIEVTGRGIVYCPKVRVKVNAPAEGGVKKLAKATFECKVFGTTSIPSGFQYDKFDT